MLSTCNYSFCKTIIAVDLMNKDLMYKCSSSFCKTVLTVLAVCR
jgi:hypothetical protein